MFTAVALVEAKANRLPENRTKTTRGFTMSVGITDDRELASGLGDAQRAVTFVRMTKVRSPMEVRGCPPLLDVGGAAGLAAYLPVSNLWHAVSYPVFPLGSCWAFKGDGGRP